MRPSVDYIPSTLINDIAEIPIPSNITTPEKVETRIRTLDFFDGLPSQETTRKVFDNLDFLRGIEVFLNCMPMTSLEGIRAGHEYMGIKVCNQMLIADQLLDSNSLFLTGDTDTVYCSGILDLEQDGPTVVEIPSGCGPGTVNDAYFRFVIDMGALGPDRGQGGAYLFLPPEYEGEVLEGYFVAKSPSYINWLILRGFLVDGKPDVANTMFKTDVKIYPLKDKDNPPPYGQYWDRQRQAFRARCAHEKNLDRCRCHWQCHSKIDFVLLSVAGKLFL